MTVNLSMLAGAGAQFFDNNGDPLSGGKVFTYSAGTTTPQATYTTSAGNIAHANPIVLDAAGRVPSGGEIWLTDSVSYKFVLTNSTGTTIGTYDNLTGNGSGILPALTASGGSSLIGFIQNGSGAVATTVQTKLRDTISVKDFGAVGDGITNDTDAFAAASAYITSLGGGKLIIPTGTYIVGKQIFAGANGKGYSYQGQPILRFLNCTKPVVVEGNGAKLKIADGLKFGSFDPVTGAVYNPVLPFTNSNYAATVGNVIFANLCTNVSVKNLEIDGNIENLSLGGFWGDAGRQLSAYGMLFESNSNVFVENVYTHHNGLDGIAIGYAGLTETSPSYPHTLINVVSEYNARQGLSWVGGTQLSAINCKFNNTGKSTFSSAPAAGVDIEAESSICRNGMFINCEFSNNTGVAMLADSGNSADISFLRCKFIGQSNYAIWPNKPRISFVDCLIVGAYVNSYASSTKPEDATKYQRCVFSDESKYASTLYNIGALGSLLSGTDAQSNVLYDACTFIATRSKAGRFDLALLRNCNFDIQAGTDYCANKDWCVIFWSSKLQNVTITDNISVNLPADGFYVGLSSTLFTGRNNLVSASGIIRWGSWSVPSGGFTGYYSESFPDQLPRQFLSINKTLFPSPYYGIIKIYAGTAAPTTGTYAAGDRVINQAPAVGQPIGWVCTVGGTPGTWVAQANL